ncbi:MAG: Maf-like protein [Roseivirga sp.]
MNLNYHLILASKSPRRQDLLKSLGLEFEIRTKDVDESFPEDMEAMLVAQYLAEKKSAAFGELAEQELLITSDTTVVLGSTILNKPADKEEAMAMLEALSGGAHEVVTGVCLRSADKTVAFSETSEVHFRELTVAEIEHYVDHYKPMDKAGAYGIQEWIGMIGIEKIVGDYYNVMGLPCQQLYGQLTENFS